MFVLPCFVLLGLPWPVFACCSFLDVTDDLGSIDYGFQNYPGTNTHDALNHASGCTESLKTLFPLSLGLSCELQPVSCSWLQAVHHCLEWFFPPARSNPRSYLVTSSSASTIHLLLCFWDNSGCQPLAIAYPFPQKMMQEGLWDEALAHCSHLSLILV